MNKRREKEKRKKMFHFLPIMRLEEHRVVVSFFSRFILFHNHSNFFKSSGKFIAKNHPHVTKFHCMSSRNSCLKKKINVHPSFKTRQGKRNLIAIYHFIILINFHRDSLIYLQYKCVHFSHLLLYHSYTIVIHCSIIVYKHEH